MHNKPKHYTPLIGMFFFASVFCLLAFSSSSYQNSSLLADEPTTEDESAKPIAEAAKPTTLEVKSERFVAKVDTKGVFIGSNFDEIQLNPKAWSTLKIVSVVPHGSSVMEGDPILVLETEDLDKAIEKAETSLISSTLALRLANDELRFMKESTAMDLESVNRSAKEAESDLAYYLETQEAEDLKSAELNLKFAQYNLEYAQEELEQLEKMYAADDLTEESEEIVLLRTRRQVEMAQRSVETAQLRRDRQIAELIPREKLNMQDRQARSALKQAESVITLPLMIRKKELDVEQMQVDLEEKKLKLAEMKEDRALMTVTAPRSGIVFYGRHTHGKWPEVSTREKQLVPGGAATANSVLMTIVDPETLMVLADLSESQLGEVANNQLAVVIPNSFVADRIPGQVASVEGVAASDGSYKATLRIKRGGDTNDQLVPGMTCSIVIRVKSVADAILIPNSTIHRDDFSEDDSPYVWIKTASGAEKRTVVLGLERDKKREILDGLNAGDIIFLEPQDPKN